MSSKKGRKMIRFAKIKDEVAGDFMRAVVFCSKCHNTARIVAKKDIKEDDDFSFVCDQCKEKLQ